MRKDTKEELRSFVFSMLYLFCILITCSLGAASSFWIIKSLGVL